MFLALEVVIYKYSERCFMKSLVAKILSYMKVQRRNWFIRNLIPAGGRVLEIGSGNNPFPFSDVLLDKYATATSIHRTGSGAISRINNKIFILGDGNHIPFKDNSFSVVVCRHVIEHVEDPATFVRELQKVSLKGYLEWPAIPTELIHGGYGDQEKIRSRFPLPCSGHLKDLEHGKGTPGNRWFIVAINNRLIFLPKSKNVYPLYLMLGKYAKEKRKRLKNIQQEKVSSRIWTERTPIETIILPSTEDELLASSLSDDYKVSEQISALNRIKSSSVNLKDIIGDIEDLFQCPTCHQGDLKWCDDLFSC